MTDPAKAVFLSYASQDAEAAKKICDALRAAGVEVWFDAEGGLEHGDEWDAKIRRQIKECVLFLPIISANTQAREEGYFRIEWELAAQRALGIASGVAFILPIVIDDTREPDALVPDRFRTVQWTRLRGGELTPEVKARFLKLWSHRTGALKHEAVSRQQRAGDGAQQTPAESLSKPDWKLYAGRAAAVFALAAGAAWWMLRPGPAPVPAALAPAGSPARPAREWPKDPELKKAFNIITGLDATVESCRLAEDMINAVLKQRPTDPEATTLYAMLNNYYINRGYDNSEERLVLARRFSERALQLAPEEPEALAAMAQYITFRGTDYARADALIRKAMALAPEEPRFARILVYNVLRPTDPARLAQAKEDAVRFPGDALTQYDLALISRGTGDLELMEQALDRTIALAPISSALIWKGWLAAWVHGDLPGFKAWLDRISGNYRFNERAVYMHYLYACLSGDTAHGLEALDAFPGAWLNDFYYTGPRSLLLADLLALAGKPELARVEYDRALAEIARTAERNGQDTVWRAEFWALRGAGREADARAAAKRMMERLSRPYRPAIMQWWHDVIPAQLLAGDRADALALIREAAMAPVVRAQIRTALKIDRRMAPFRDDPDIQALLGDAAKSAAVAGPASRVWPKHPELKKAIDLVEGTESIPDDFALAEQIVKPIVDRAPTDIEAVTVMARVQSQYMRRGFDRSDERSALARLYGERALQLDPNEPEAMLAVATYLYSRVTGEARAERLLRRAMELDPANPRHGRMLADLLNVLPGRQAEAIAQSQENVRRFPQDALSRYDLARHYKDQGRYEEFDRELDAVLALTPLPNAIAWKARLQFGLHNDFPGMKRWLDQVPERVRGTERAVFGYFLYAAFGGDTETGLEALRAFTQKWFTDFEYAGPTALLTADLLMRQGKAELARQQYEAAWLEIQRMRTTEPARIWLNHAEFWTLLGLGRKAEAKLAFGRLVEAQRRPYGQSLFTGWWFTLIPGALLIGERDTALEFLRECVAPQPEVRGAIRLRMQLDPRMAPFREDPEINAILAEPAGRN
jgi:tetratricopeptide (TPR) repeat protein